MGTKRFSFLHFPAHIDAPSWCRKPYIVTVLDLIPTVCADLYRAGRSGWRFRLARWLEDQAVRNAGFVLTISEHGGKDVHSLLGVPWERIRVTHLGVNETFFRHEDEEGEETLERGNDLPFEVPLHRPRMLYVGGIDQRKNIKQLIRTFSETVRHFRCLGAPEPVLIMSGRIEEDDQFPLLQRWIREYSVENDVIMTGYVSDLTLRRLYRTCACFFFPSLYEGFGLTPLEAMAAGAPVVSSNRSAMPEVLGPAAMLVDPEDTEQCVRSVIAVLSDRALQNQMRDRGVRHARKFSWERTAHATLAAYRDAAKII